LASAYIGLVTLPVSLLLKVSSSTAEDPTHRHADHVVHKDGRSV